MTSVISTAPTPTLPASRVAAGGQVVTVAVIGSPTGIGDLPRHLPANWVVAFYPPDGTDDGPADVVVLDRATAVGVEAARRRFPGVPIVGLVAMFAPVDIVVEVLEAGADACVRSGMAALIGSHLRACLRRAGSR